MTTAAVTDTTGPRHEAFVHRGDAEFAAGAGEFIRGGLERDEPVLVMVGARRIELLRDVLQADAGRVRFADMSRVGANPAHIIPAWLEFIGEHAASGRQLRGIGEPIWPGRRDAELAECEVHEMLLNVALEGVPMWLLCPYDADGLDGAVVEHARRTHPVVSDVAGAWRSPDYDPAAVGSCFEQPLPEPPPHAERLSFDAATLHALRHLVARTAARAGLGAQRIDDLVLAVNEVATNSVAHGGGGGVLLAWSGDDRVLCEVRDGGRFDQPLAGRRRPNLSTRRGHGLWLANQLCDLVQVRTTTAGTAVRLHMLRRR
jgi:anti-sigma regulatory factor (Ser/Thr protein kinase)